MEDERRIARLVRRPSPTTERSPPVPDPIATGGIHHLRLTVTDVDRARAFYTLTAAYG
jgi:hypothetical protein